MGANLAMLGEAHSNLGRLDEGIALLEKARLMSPHCGAWLGYLGLAYVRAGRRADAERFLTELEQESKRQYVSGFAPAICALALGDTERALDWLEIAAEDRDGWLGFLPGNPHFEALRSQSRFVEIMKGVNLPAYTR
jgi:tetratricopeptide (TPR) repeat protein